MSNATLDELAAAQAQRPLTTYERGRLRALALTGDTAHRHRAAELAAADAQRAPRDDPPPPIGAYERGQERAQALDRRVDLAGLIEKQHPEA